MSAGTSTIWSKIWEKAKALSKVTVIVSVGGLVVSVAGFLVKAERDREAQIRDQQAALSTVGPTNFPQYDELYTIKMGIYNGGKTTAYDVGGAIHILVAPADLPDPKFDAANYKSGHLVDITATHGQYHSQIMIPQFEGNDSERLAIQKRQLDGVASGKLNFWIYGGANFTTEYGDKGWIEYCFELQRNLHDVNTCAGDRNQFRVVQKSWIQTLISALPGWKSQIR